MNEWPGARGLPASGRSGTSIRPICVGPVREGTDEPVRPAIRRPWASDGFRVRDLAVQRHVDSCGLPGLVGLHWRDPVDDPEHAVGEDKRPDGGDADGTELDEEEESLDRLRRWYRSIRARDLFGAPRAAAAEKRLKDCAEALEHYAELVYEAREPA